MLSGERAGLVIYTFSPVRLLLLWRRGSSGSLDLVFFHLVTKHCLKLGDMPAFQAGPVGHGGVCHSRQEVESPDGMKCLFLSTG